MHSGKRYTLYGAKDENGSSMGRGYKSIGKLSTFFRRALPLLLLCGFAGSSVVAAHAQSAKAWNKRGEDAEARQDYDAAYEAYHNATLKSPKDLRYKVHYENMRFQASVAHVDRGRVLRQNGDINGALTEYTRALQIDPANQAAQQEIDSIQAQQRAEQEETPQAKEQMSRQNETLNSIGSISGPVELKPLSNDPIPAIHMVEDVKVIYQAIGKAAGFNVLFDPDYTSKRIPVDLTNVSWSDALRIVGTLSGTFYKPVTSNTIFVAQNTRTKRTDLDEQAVQTFYLTNASQPNDANELVVAIRNLLDPSVKIYVVPSQNAIVMRATPDELLIAQKLLNDLDRARPEVVVDVAVLEVNRNVEHNLGITLPQSITITPQATPGTTTSSGSTSTSGTTPTTPSNFTLNTLAHMNANNFAVSIGGGTLNALLNDADTRILQNPSIRATDGQRATMKIGSRIPIATGSYNAGVSTGVASIGVQTQFTYLDIGVNIDMTPTVHYDREITLKMKIEVLSQLRCHHLRSHRAHHRSALVRTGHHPQGRRTQPAFRHHHQAGQPQHLRNPRRRRTASSEILLHLPRQNQRQDRNCLHHHSSHRPRVRPHPRQHPRHRHRHRPVDRTAPRRRRHHQRRHRSYYIKAHAPKINPPVLPTPQSPWSSSSASRPSPLLRRPPASPSPRQQTPPPPPDAVNFTVVPASSNQAVGSTFQVAVMLGNGHDIYSVPLQMKFNPAVLQLVNVDSGDFLSRDGQPSPSCTAKTTASSPSPPLVLRTPPASPGREVSAPSPSRPLRPETPTSPSSKSALSTARRPIFRPSVRRPWYM